VTGEACPVLPKLFGADSAELPEPKGPLGV
jgi:hypothetical protein